MRPAQTATGQLISDEHRKDPEMDRPHHYGDDKRHDPDRREPIPAGTHGPCQQVDGETGQQRGDQLLW